MPFNYEEAIKSGYTEDEVLSYLAQKNPSFDVKKAKESGYSAKEINQHLSGMKPQESKEQGPSKTDEGGVSIPRVAAQFGVSMLEGSALPYEMATAPYASQEVMSGLHRQQLGRELEFLLEKKAYREWNENDQNRLDAIKEQLRDPKKLDENAPKSFDIGVRSLIEKTTGADLRQQGIAEKAASWAGFLKSPKAIAQAARSGSPVKEIIKAISPSGRETLSSLGAGTMLQLAEEGEFGPIGHLASAVFGDVAGHLVYSGLSGVKYFLKNPLKAMASAAAKFTKKDKLALQKEIIQDFRESGIQADIGTITDSDLMKWIQSRLAQSGLTGDALDKLKENVTRQVKEEYHSIADGLGKAAYETKYEGGKVLKEGVEKIRQADLNETKKVYQEAMNELGDTAFENSRPLIKAVDEIEAALKPGSVKSAQQEAVLGTIQKLKKDLYNKDGYAFANVKDLINNKRAIQDLIDYEVQGGVKQMLKGLASDIDRTVIAHGKSKPRFAKLYIKGNQRFSKHAKEFRNKKMSALLRTEDPEQVLNHMNTTHGIKSIRNILEKTEEGREIFGSLARTKLDELVHSKMIDNVTGQIKMGTFSGLMEKGKGKDLIRELVPQSSYKKLKRLQKNVAKLQESAQKFLNASKSGITLEDAGVVAKVIGDMAHLLYGNPWPFIRTAAGISGARYLTKLIADPAFLRLVEDAVEAAEKDSSVLMKIVSEKMAEYIKRAQIL